MYYELYVDSLFLVNFVMNLYLLLLVNQSMYRTATRLRLMLGAGVGAVLYLVPFLCNGAVWLELLLGFVGGTIAMIYIAFPICNIRAFWQIVERLLLYSLLIGGILLFLIRRVPFFKNSMMGIAGILGMGAFAFLGITYFQEHRKEKEVVCCVTLIHGAESIGVSALIDSGNSLVEPISGKPVSVIERSAFARLWKKEPDFYRAIPFHSIGKKKGIMRGYLLPEIRIELNGVVKTCRDVYVAVSEERITEADEEGAVKVRMILNPALLEDRGVRKRKNINKRIVKQEKRGIVYDIKSSSSGEDAF